jgi:tetratricopeptide (TPR) repeat protein
MARTYENLGLFNESLDELRNTVDLDQTNLTAKAKLANYFLLVQPPMIGEAERIRQEILAADPKFIEGNLLTASVMVAQGRPERDIVTAIYDTASLDPKRIEPYIGLERFYLVRFRVAEAEAAIKEGIAANPSSTLGYTEYGRFLTYSSRDAEAEVQFKKAIELDPSSIEPREAIAGFYETSAQFEKAEAAYKDLTQILGNSPASRLRLAEFYDTAGRRDAAIAALKEMLADTPEYVRAQIKLGEIYLDLKQFDKVDEQVTTILSMNDEDADALILRARSKMQQSKVEDVVKDIEQVLKKYPTRREALYLIAQAKLSLGQIDQARAFIADLDHYHPSYLRCSLLKIQTALLAGEAELAIKESTDLFYKANSAAPTAGLSPNDMKELRFRARSSRGLAYLDLGKISDARNDLEAVLTLAPRSSSAMVDLAKVFIAEKNPAGALDLYEKAMDANPENFDAVTGLVGTYIRLGQTAKAHARIDGLISVNGDKPDVLASLHYLKSTVFSAETNTGAQESELRQSIATNENYLPAYSAYAALLVKQNRADEAIAQYANAVTKKPSAQVYTMLGILEEAHNNVAEAEKDYRKALEITPGLPIAANNLAWLLTQNGGNLDEALQLASAAVAKNPTVAGFCDTLGFVYLKKGLYSPAATQFKKAVALDEANTQKTGAPPTAGYRERLTMALARTGDADPERRAS